jgi:hypothetical protein
LEPAPAPPHWQWDSPEINILAKGKNTSNKMLKIAADIPPQFLWIFQDHLIPTFDRHS